MGRRRQEALERVELPFPEGAIVSEPIGGARKGTGHEPADAHAPFLARSDEAGALEVADVLEHPRKGEAVRCPEFRDGSLPLREPLQHGASDGVGQGAEGPVERRLVYH